MKIDEKNVEQCLGYQVRLLEFDNGDEVIPEEFGVLAGYHAKSGVATIFLYSDIPLDDDDGIREVTLDQIETI